MNAIKTDTRIHSIVMAGALGLAVTACGPENPSNTRGPVAADGDAAEPAQTTSAIEGSARIDDNDFAPRWPSVVRLDAFCTGTLVSPVHVLTAGHCGTPSYVWLDSPAGAGTGDLSRRRYRVLSKTNLNTRPMSGQDLAVLLLDRAVARAGGSGAPNYAVQPTSIRIAFHDDDDLWSVGYGRDCSGGGSGTRRGIELTSSFSTYDDFPGVVSAFNPGCNGSYEGPQPGDSGGPLLTNGGQLAAVFSGWSNRRPDGVVGGGTGTIEWTSMTLDNALWVYQQMYADTDGDGIWDLNDPLPSIDCRGSTDPQCAAIQPDFDVTAIRSDSCTGTGGDPVVGVTVVNHGPGEGRAQVDLFLNLSAAPSLGERGDYQVWTDYLAPGASQTLYVPVEPGRSGGYVDVIVDTLDRVEESNESNNTDYAYIRYPNCSFN